MASLRRQTKQVSKLVEEALRFPSGQRDAATRERATGATRLTRLLGSPDLFKSESLAVCGATPPPGWPRGQLTMARPANVSVAQLAEHRLMRSEVAGSTPAGHSMPIEPAWFECDEHKAVQACVCICGHRFESQARKLPCVTTREVVDENEKVTLENGVPKTELVGIVRRISRQGCPKCSSNWIASFAA